MTQYLITFSTSLRFLNKIRMSFLYAQVKLGLIDIDKLIDREIIQGGNENLLYFLALNPTKWKQEIYNRNRINVNSVTCTGYTPLITNILFGQYKFLKSQAVEAVKYLLEQPSIKINEICSATDSTPLMLAAATGNIMVVKSLIEADIAENIDLHIKNSEGHDALFFSVLSDDIEIFKYLCEHNMSINVQDHEKNNLLMFAVQHDKANMFEFLIDKFNIEDTNNSGKTAIHLAFILNSKKCLDHIFKIRNMNFEIKDDQGFTPILTAAQYNDVKLIEKLYKHKANIHALDTENNNILQIAVFYRSVPVVDFLLNVWKNKIDIKHKNSYGNNAMLVCATSYHKKNFKLLMKHKCDVQLTNNTGDNALTLSVLNQQIEMVEYLLSHKIFDINYQTNNKLTALHNAVLSDDIDIVTKLVENGADILSEDLENNTPIAYAVVTRSVEILRYFLEYSPEMINHKYHYGTILHLAILHKYQDIADLILQYDIDIYAKNAVGKTALDLAKEDILECHSIAEMIIEKSIKMDNMS